MEESVSLEELAASAEEAPVINLVNMTITRAVQSGASDIHIEPRENSVGLRYRIDGVLQEQDSIPKKFARSLVSRMKIMANLDIAERRLPQDGRSRIHYENRYIDLRISVLPSRYGEKVVLRLLDKGSLSLAFDALGFEATQMKLVQASIQKPHGILLITGPTGSGKTTTLYTALQALNDTKYNIITVEDPIEYELHRVTQVQVNVATGLTFPVALRSILRQDPDIIMIGEIRDHETLDIAVKAALTGHLVLSTVHTNDAPGTVARLVDMGAEPFMIAASLEMIVAQRLLRKLCNNCKKPTDVPEETLKRLNAPVPAKSAFCKAVGCAACHGSGYKGRVAALEVMAIDEELRRLIAHAADVEALRKHALSKCGMSTLQEDALGKAARGVTTVEEVLRAAG